MHIQKNHGVGGSQKPWVSAKENLRAFGVFGSEGGTSSVYRGTESGTIAIVRDLSFANSPIFYVGIVHFYELTKIDEV